MHDSRESACAGISGAGVVPDGFALECLFYTASVCLFYNLKNFICVILQIYKLRKNILLNIINMKIMNMYVYIKTGKKCSVLKAAE